MVSESKVFVPQVPMRWDGGSMVPTYDLRPAEKYGELVYLVSPRAAPWTTSVIEEIRERLTNEFDPTRDYLLPLGNPCLIGVVTTIAASFCGEHEPLRLLHWSGPKSGYEPIEIILP